MVIDQGEAPHVLTGNAHGKVPAGGISDDLLDLRIVSAQGFREVGHTGLGPGNINAIGAGRAIGAHQIDGRAAQDGALVLGQADVFFFACFFVEDRAA